MKFFLLLFLPLPAFAETVSVPSGQLVELVEKIVDLDGPEGLTWRYRLVAPQISRNEGSVAHEVASRDIDAICSDFVRIQVQQTSEPPAQVIITLMDQIVPFGELAPHATQFVEAYRIEGDTCIWEGL